MEQHAAAFYMHITPFLVGLMGVLWSVLVIFVGYWIKRIAHKVDALSVHKESCITSFANRERNTADHDELFKRTNSHEIRITKLETQVEHMKDDHALLFSRENRTDA